VDLLETKVPWPNHNISNLPVYHKFFLCGNYGNLLVMSKTCHISEFMDVYNLTHIVLSHTSRSHYNKDGTFPRLQVHGQWSFVESIGGEESPCTSACIALPTRYGFNSCGFCAVLSGETNGHQCPLLLHCATMHPMPHEHHISQYLIATYPLWFDFSHIFLKPSQGSHAIPAILMPLV